MQLMVDPVVGEHTGDPDRGRKEHDEDRDQLQTANQTAATPRCGRFVQSASGSQLALRPAVFAQVVFLFESLQLLDDSIVFFVVQRHQ